jgi:hypothetical protein
MKRKNAPHSVTSETQSLSPKGKAIDDREACAVGRRSFVRQMRVAGASLALVVALLFTSSAMANDIIVKFNGGIGVIPASTIGSANAVLGVQPPGEPCSKMAESM